MSELEIQNWLSNFTETIKSKDLDKHMELVSENVMVYGMPNGKTLNYAGWRDKRKNEFKLNLTTELSFNNLQIKNLGLRRLIFTIQEIMEGVENDHAVIDKKIVLEQEHDNEWRVIEESIQN